MKPLVSFLILLSPVSSFAVEVPVIFEVDTETSEARLDMSVSAFGSDSDTLDLSGTLEAVLQVEPETGRLEGIEFTGGLVTFSPGELDFSFSGVTLEIGFSTLTAVPNSPDGPEILENDSGTLSPSNHPLDFTSGTVTLDTRAPGQSPDITVIDVTESSQNEGVDPDSLASIDDLSVTISEVSRSESSITWEVTYLATGTISETQTEDGISITLASNLTLQARANFSTLTNYGSWLLEQGLEMDIEAGSRSQKGVPLALLHAFDLSTDAETLPFVSMSQMNGKPAVMIDCPEGGLRREIFINHSTTLNPATARERLGSLSAGTAGLQEIAFPEGPKNFAWLSTQ